MTQAKLTQTGKKLLNKVRPLYSQWFTTLIGPLTEPKRQQLVNSSPKNRHHLAGVSANEPVLSVQDA